MEKRRLGHTDIEVSKICLGTMTWGDQNSADEAFAQLDLALERGINFIDTAEMYPVPPKADTYTKTEQYIGNWLEKRKNRADIILATKVVGRTSNAYMREQPIGLDRKNITQALEGSLRRLKTDYIDLYQLHWPDRPTNYFGQLGYVHRPAPESIPLAETLAVLDDLIKQGKIRHCGLSNETPWGVMGFLHLADQGKGPRMVSIQNPYNLLNRTYEIGLAEISHRENIGLLAYSPLGFGVLSGKYLQQNPEGARLTLWAKHFSRYSNPNAIKATKAYVELAKSASLSPAQMALAFVTSRSFVTSNIIGATSLEQLKENIDSVDTTLSDDVLREIEKIHARFSNPSP